MHDRRCDPRLRIDQAAHIAVDEHCSLACIVFDRSSTGVRVTLLDAAPVPDCFVLTMVGLGEVLVCDVAWRRDDEIGAKVRAPDLGRTASPGLRRQRIPA